MSRGGRDARGEPEAGVSAGVIVALDECHLELARAIYNHYVATSTATFHERPIERDEFAAMVLFGHPRHRSFVVMVDGETVGYGSAAPYKSRCSYRDAVEVAVYLDAGHTGRGYGRALIERIEQHARRHAVHTLIAGVCTENKRSIALFERLGYRRCADFREVGWKFGRRLDVAYLQKLLPDDPSRRRIDGGDGAI